jgi:uncharacterized Zn finger protein
MDYSQKERLNRALKQRMYLISASSDSDTEWYFQVEGYSGTTYSLKFDQHKMQCNCPDYKQRHRICKHIYFIIGRVLKDLPLMDSLKSSDPNISIFDIRENLSDKLNIILNPRLNIHKEKESIIKPDEDCAICFEDYENDVDNSQCKTCKKYFHKDCIKVWLKKATRSTCPLCRSSWLSIDTDDSICDPMEKFKKSGKIIFNNTENYVDTEISGNSFR